MHNNALFFRFPHAPHVKQNNCQGYNLLSMMAELQLPYKRPNHCLFMLVYNLLMLMRISAI